MTEIYAATASTLLYRTEMKNRKEITMTKEQLKRAVELHRSLEQLKGISDYFHRPCKEENYYFRTTSIGGQGFKMPNILVGEFMLAVERCITEVEEEIKEL